MWPSPIANVVLARRATNVNVNPSWVADAVTVSGPSVVSHSGCPTTAMSHSLAAGSGPSLSTGSGR